MNKIILIIIIILIVVIGWYSLLRVGYQTPTEISAPEGEGVSPSEVKEITVVGTEFAFSPSVITVQAAQKIKLSFKNEGRAPHNLIINGLGISTKTIGSNQQDTIGFTAPASGTFTFFCSIPGHRSSGMEGSLKVE